MYTISHLFIITICNHFLIPLSLAFLLRCVGPYSPHSPPTSYYFNFQPSPPTKIRLTHSGRLFCRSTIFFTLISCSRLIYLQHLHTTHILGIPNIGIPFIGAEHVQLSFSSQNLHTIYLQPSLYHLNTPYPLRVAIVGFCYFLLINYKQHIYIFYPRTKVTCAMGAGATAMQDPN